MAKQSGILQGLNKVRLDLACVLVGMAMVLISVRMIPDVSMPAKVESSKGYLKSIPIQFTIGFATFFSSMEWVQYVFRYADSILEHRRDASLAPLIKSVCDLDTNWLYPRLVAGWTLNEYDPVQRTMAISILTDGAQRFPEEWRFRLTWAGYIQSDRNLDSAKAFDSAAKILLPLSRMDTKIPTYARELAFTLLQKSGKPEQAILALLQTYEQIPDPLIRFQFQNKIADLLRRNEVSLGASDSAAFFQAIGGMLDSKDASQVGMAKGLLVRLVQPEHKVAALAEAHQLAEQFKVYQKQAAAGR